MVVVDVKQTFSTGLGIAANRAGVVLLGKHGFVLVHCNSVKIAQAVGQKATGFFGTFASVAFSGCAPRGFKIFRSPLCGFLPAGFPAFLGLLVGFVCDLHARTTAIGQAVVSRGILVKVLEWFKLFAAAALFHGVSPVEKIRYIPIEAKLWR
jgi:hypothetical protein